MAANIKILKMISGEELLAEVVSETETHISVKNPVRVIVMPTKTSPQNPTVGFAPWADFSEEKQFTIHRAHVIVTMKPVSEFVSQYNSMFGGIVTPPSSKLIIPGT
jgi:hypothetical protein